jgi:hypothetical protein
MRTLFHLWPVKERIRLVGQTMIKELKRIELHQRRDIHDSISPLASGSAHHPQKPVMIMGAGFGIHKTSGFGFMRTTKQLVGGPKSRRTEQQAVADKKCLDCGMAAFWACAGIPSLD